jgi:hypothetical protein
MMRIYARKIFSYVFVFVLAWLPRFSALDTFVSPDAWDWVEGSRDFLAALLNRDFAGTFRTDIPGVTTMWTGAVAILLKFLTRPEAAPTRLADFVAAVPVNPLDVSYLTAMRIPSVVITSLSVVAFFWLAARLFDRQAALVAACLFAFNPFAIGHSRVLHQDVLTATFMTMSLLSMIGYWWQGWSRRWLVLSGAMAGLAFLSKSSAMLLMPFCALAGAWASALRWRSGQLPMRTAVTRLIRDGLMWGAAAWITYSLVWPAMWVEPIPVLRSVFSLSAQHASEAHDLGSYFFGRPTTDPGVFFYPVSWLLRATPLNLLGLGALLLPGKRRNQPEPEKSDRTSMAVYLLLAYVFFVVLLLGFGAKKSDRYILPIFLALDLLAGLGLVRLGRFLHERWQKPKHRQPGFRQLEARQIFGSQPGYAVLVAGVVLLQGIPVWLHHPYHLTYYNPLLGGARLAERLVPIGWGEGLSQAAAYLNQKPDAERLRVTAWYHQAFAPYFRGQSTYFFSIGDALGSDYVVLYRNQLQRGLPDPDLLAYFQHHHVPEYTARLHGADYALVYRVPLDRRALWQSSNLLGKLILYGYRQESLQPGVSTVRLLWENQGMSGEDRLWMGLRPYTSLPRTAAGEAPAWQPCAPDPAFAGELKQTGALVESVCSLDTAGLAPGVYSLHAGVGGPDGKQVYDLLAPGGELGVLVSNTGAPTLVSPQEALDALATATLPPGALPLHISYADLVALVGFQVIPPASAGAAQAAEVHLYWLALQDLAQPGQIVHGYRVRFDILTADGNLVASSGDSPLSLATDGGAWRAGRLLVDSHRFDWPDDLGPGSYRLDLALIDASTGRPVPVRDEASGLVTAGPVRLTAAIDVPE